MVYFILSTILGLKGGFQESISESQYSTVFGRKSTIPLLLDINHGWKGCSVSKCYADYDSAKCYLAVEKQEPDASRNLIESGSPLNKSRLSYLATLWPSAHMALDCF